MTAGKGNGKPERVGTAYSYSSTPLPTPITELPTPITELRYPGTVII